MKQKILAALLAVCLVVCLLPRGQEADASSGLGFISVNDELLTLDSMSYSADGVTYVPYWVFQYFGIYYSYFSQSTTASLYTADQQLYFEMTTGVTYDHMDQVYTAGALFRSGAVYVPVDFVCNYFGLTWSYISGNAYGSIVRIKNAQVILSDADFLAAATNAMRRYYNAYYGITPSTPNPGTPAPGESEDPEESPTPSPSATIPLPSQTVDRSDTTIYLAFLGLPSEDILDLLESYSIRAAFFLTAEEVRAQPALVRTLAVQGHSLGVCCGTDAAADYQETAALIFEAARISTLLVTAAPENLDACAAAAEELGLACWRYDVFSLDEEGEARTVADLMAAVDDARGSLSVCLTAGDDDIPGLSTLLRYLNLSNFTLLPIREIQCLGA